MSLDISSSAGVKADNGCGGAACSILLAASSAVAAAIALSDLTDLPEIDPFIELFLDRDVDLLLALLLASAGDDDVSAAVVAAAVVMGWISALSPPVPVPAPVPELEAGGDSVRV